MSFVLVYLVESTASGGAGQATNLLAVSAVEVTNIIGPNVAGVASDWFGHDHLASACADLIGSTTASLRMFGGPIAFLALAAGFGIGYGGICSLISPLLAELFGTDGLYALFGLTRISFAVAGSVAPYLSGTGYESLGTFQPVFVTAGVVGLLAVGLFTSSGPLVTPDD